MPLQTIPSLTLNGLYRQDIYTDLVIGNLNHFVPVEPDGSIDASRPPKFNGNAILFGPNGQQVPLQFDVDGGNLIEAGLNWSFALEKACIRMQNEALRRTLLAKQ
jgi:hypothetical protein